MNWNCILERVATTKSTNDDLLERWRAGELIDPVARIAQEQTAGKGRAGRIWHAKPEDTLCFSLAYPFHCRPNELSGLSLVIGLAVIAGISQALGIDQTRLHQLGLRLKWPNDLLLNNAKLGGVLIEGGQTSPHSPSWMIIGLGLNLRNAHQIAKNISGPSSLGVAALDQLIAETNALPENEYIWLKLIESFEIHLTEFSKHGFQYFKNEWLHWDAFAHQAITISGAGKEEIHGISTGVDDNGALLLNQDDQILAIHAGDVSLRAQL
ncbi:MAG: biotin--[acetyl-CoA-carboxylase] ligase [Polynucleobacter sp. 24-46-87]|jgi:BirA family biotin operon repressor/biotin-[acetyl-CoA-carboxylase] ligase|nr:MAG: biotin--[acetyl-CoA-carboxylase] ligase [Polynucleobacter sp. 24-46-87]OZA32565.1 MAG: biotin--[acetyl-CoA-carboxylase] ligase [Polynucleobacter sp. 17-46-58]HQS60348.1 biotin--[acetyl-CoA-carboxylase] ligase [Polynucleobacter sp.]HQT19925.1 biotin--[acetyl-CoA-carboxylase] ligase [Polynucleobacter sp.]HQT41746.1 biotin--[acetyl-CoA-carboxylase] ligase [Polynucleobacter sp.]